MTDEPYIVVDEIHVWPPGFFEGWARENRALIERMLEHTTVVRLDDAEAELVARALGIEL